MRLGGDGFAGDALRAAPDVLDELRGERTPAERVSGIEPVVCSVLVYETSGRFAAAWGEALRNGGISAVVAVHERDALRLLAARVFDVAIVGFDVASAASDFARPFRACMREGSLVFVVEHLRAEDVLELRTHGDLILPGPVEPCMLPRAVQLLGDEEDDVSHFARERKLSPREAELLRLALSGLNNDEAAESLGCSRATVSTFWNRIFRKSGVSGQRDVVVELLRSAQQRGTFRVGRLYARRS